MEEKISTKHFDVLYQLHNKLVRSNIIWAITGSLGLFLQGIDVHVDDIDIQTNEKGAYDIEGLFPEFVTKPVSFSVGERIKSHFGTMIIDEIVVEIMGDIQKLNSDGSWETPIYLENLIDFIEMDGLNIPVLSLSYECKAYFKLGRNNMARTIKDWLNSKDF